MDYMKNLFNQITKRKDEKPRNLGEELRKVIQSKDFETTFDASTPILLSSMAVWPLVWFYRGVGWSDVRAEQPIRLYIRKTFYQAKMMQLLIVAAGILYVINRDPLHTMFKVQNVKQDRKKSEEEQPKKSERIHPYFK